MNLVRLGLYLVSGLALLCMGVVLYLLQAHPQVSFSEQAEKSSNGQLKMLFLGTSSMAWTDGKSTWLVDGFFSRPSLGKVILTPLKVDENQVDAVASEVFKRLKVPAELTGILVAHSHYDHSLDAPYLALRHGGKVVGSDSTWQVGRGQGLPAAQMEVPLPNTPVGLGAFQVRMLQSAHAPTGFTGGFNSNPVELPAHALSFKEGISYTFVVSHPLMGTKPFALIQPSAGFVQGQNKGLKVEHVFLGTGGLGKLDEAYVLAYWQEMVLETGAKKVYLIHWDDFTLPLLQQGAPATLKPMPRMLDNLPKSLELLTRLSERDQVELKMLQAWQMLYFKN